MQALIDTRNEVERWADHQVEVIFGFVLPWRPQLTASQFHFATLLSPWIRRALIAGGFGTGTSASRVPREIAQVVPYRDHSNPAELHKLEGESDAEAGDIKPQKVLESPDPSLEGYVPVVEMDTPFFHLDLAAAVRAAESGAERL